MSVEAPPLEVPEDPPAVGADEFEARIAALRSAADSDWVIVYGDREHAASLIFLSNLDPRFEEALLVLGPDRRTLIVGKEDVGYVPIVPIDVDVVCCPTFSLMGIDRSDGPTLEAALRDLGISDGDRIGVVGWKALRPEEWSGRAPAIFAPAFFVDTLREIAGESGVVQDVTPLLTNPRSGLRTFASADQIAVFEWGASRCSAWVHAIVAAARPGVTEREAFRAAPWGGEPLTYHPVFASGPDVAVGLRSPSSRRIELGDAAVTAVGLWGGNCARGGIVAASADEFTSASDGYLERLAIPYWRAMATWYEALEVGVDGGAVFEAVTGLLAAEEFASSLNPGHLIHYEEWLDSPIRRGSTDPIASGMVLQSDIIPTGIRVGWTINCEDTVAIADASLRGQIQARHPELWTRIQARQQFVREALGIALRDEVLPLSCTPAYFRPMWLSPDLALAFS
ncbi:MAG: M24 family metallopeptidase [Solirubrobacteraceae bacterium]